MIMTKCQANILTLNETESDGRKSPKYGKLNN